MTTLAITEKTEDQFVIENSHDVWPRVRREITVPPALSGKHVCAVAVVTDVKLDDTQEAALEAAIENIAGVQLAKILVGASRLSLDRLPADTATETHAFKVHVTMGFDATKTVVTP